MTVLLCLLVPETVLMTVLFCPLVPETAKDSFSYLLVGTENNAYGSLISLVFVRVLTYCNVVCLWFVVVTI